MSGASQGITSAVASGAALKTGAGGESDINPLIFGNAFGALFKAKQNLIQSCGEEGVQFTMLALGTLGLNAFGDMRGKSGIIGAIAASLSFEGFADMVDSPSFSSGFSGSSGSEGGDSGSAASGSNHAFPSTSVGSPGVEYGGDMSMAKLGAMIPDATPGKGASRDVGMGM